MYIYFYLDIDDNNKIDDDGEIEDGKLNFLKKNKI